jgi:CRISPR-associated protein Cst1
MQLHFTGHALVDVGMAGLCVFAKRARPEDLTPEDLDGAADYMKEHYYGGALNAYLSCVFMNSSFVQPSEGKDKTQAFIAQYLYAHRAAPHPNVAGMLCAFSGEPATSPLVRTHLPMFSGEGVMNFRPNASTFVPAAGPYVVALMFLPLASRRAEGRLLAVHADDSALTIRFARKYLEDNRRLLSLALPTERAPVHPGFERELPMWDAQKKRYKFADVKGPRSLVIDDLASMASEALPSDARPNPTALTAYLLSSSGQGPSLDVFQVPSGVVAFVAKAAGATTARAWKAIAARYRPVSEQDEATEEGAPRKKKNAAQPIAGRAGWTRNPAFEELCAIFAAGFTDRALAARWLRRHVLDRVDRENGRVSYRDGSARSFALTELFLKEVLGMREGRIKAIRAFADKLAAWIHSKTDKKLYNALTFGKMADLQHALRRVQRESADGEALLFGLDEYRDVWLHDDGDAYLVRDLLCIRVVEVLHDRGYFKAHPEDILEGREASETETVGAEAGQ